VELINVDFDKVILDTQPCSEPSIYDQLEPPREDSDSYRQVSRKALSFIFASSNFLPAHKDATPYLAS
jgi:hypothetical protein